MHSDVRRRWDAGDSELIAAMAEVAGLAEKGRQAPSEIYKHSLCITVHAQPTGKTGTGERH